MSDQLKQNPFLLEVEKILLGLGLDVQGAKHVVPNGALFYFNFNDVPVYVCVPLVFPCSYSNITRIEAEVAELDEVGASQLLVAITSYLQVEDCTPVRVTTKRVKAHRAKVLITFVCDLQLLQAGAVAKILLHCCELADQMRNELVEAQDKAA